LEQRERAAVRLYEPVAMGRELQWATTAEGDGRPQQSAGWTERTDAPAAAPRVGRPVEPPAAQGAGALREGAAGRRPAGGEPGRGGWAASDGRRVEAEQCGGRRGKAGMCQARPRAGLGGQLGLGFACWATSSFWASNSKY
jgi:hypothetical protein